MDYHRQFRFGSINQVPRIVGPGQPRRLPLSSTPGPRSRCTHQEHTADEGTTLTPPNPDNSLRPPRFRRLTKPSAAPSKVRAQVKQLQFWLKVFSRFCQDDNHAD